MADTPNDAPEELPIYKRVEKLEEEIIALEKVVNALTALVVEIAGRTVILEG